MDVTCEYEGLDEFPHEVEEEIQIVMELVGEEAVEYAKANGDYRNITGNLRRSNKYKVEKDGLTVYNDATYASDVESRGYEVISGAALFAEKRLKEEFEQ